MLHHRRLAALLMLAWPPYSSTCSALQPRRRIVPGAELLGTAQIPRDMTTPGAGVLGGLSGLSSDSASGSRVYAVSDRGDIFSVSVNVSTTEGLQVAIVRRFHAGISGGNPSRPQYVDAEGIAVCRSGSGVEAPLLVSTEDPPRVARLFKADGSVWTTTAGPPALPPVRLSHIINESSTRRNGQLESLSCWTGDNDAEGIAGATAAPAAGTIYTANELSLHQDIEPPELWDVGSIGGSVRIFSIDRSTGQVQRTTRYVLDRRSGNGLVDLEAVGPNGALITMERAYESGVGNTIKIYAVDSLTEVPDASACASVSESSGCAAAVTKRLIVDLGTMDGVELDNYEGMAVLPKPLPDGRR
eukprot:COSAG02_NODE_1543_length_12003_cov_16.681536_5_plen_358_part_00